MIELIYVFVAGGLCATAVWFFVWRNNKKKFQAALEQADQFVDDGIVLKAELLHKFDDAIDQVSQIVEDGKNTKTQMIKKLRELLEVLKK